VRTENGDDEFLEFQVLKLEVAEDSSTIVMWDKICSS
jgi:hypothetical protein